MYIELMESDPIFASGRVPRDYDLNYLTRKWKELSDRLNKCGSGPTLTAEEWRKVSFSSIHTAALWVSVCTMKGVWRGGRLCDYWRQMTRTFVAAPKRLEEHDALQVQTQPDVQREGHIHVVTGDASTQFVWQGAGLRGDANELEIGKG